MSDQTHDHPGVAQFAVGSAALAVDSLRQLTRGSARIVRRLGDRGGEAVIEGRDAATSAVRSRVDESIDWISHTVAPKVIDKMTPYLADTLVPKLLDRMMPYLTDSVVPRMIDSAMPHIRAKVLPIIIEDLTHDPEVRGMISEQGRGVLTDAAIQLRESTASADDRVETGFRKLFHLPQTQN
ncbi:hypothetical protein F4553_006273 [Allocatelliglobosispora scoriae]|uniref:Uncharacterized protein n=1 Tax=Allocatelliglobosispora scoriae TaxID=643052 RepID=A0A841C0G4_9ACTN|nr:hypothetical protein [Allocatelliglobosispora scoriae]MBB5872839.1 hypothetical protein [Allocatelliglobosispora scoriae]